MKKLLIIPLLLFVIASASYGQFGLAYGYSSTGAGIGKIFPSFKSEVNTQPWTSFLIRNGIWEFQFAQGDFTYGEPGTEGYQEDKGTYFNAGFVLPIHNLTILQRKKYMRGIHIVPLVGLHYSTHGMGRWDGIGAGQSGVNVAAGLSIQFPLGMIDLRVNNGFYFGGDQLKEVMSRYRNANYMMTPTVTFQLDGMFENLGGSIVNSGEYTSTWRSLEEEEVEYDEYGTFRLKTTRRKYKYNRRTGESNAKLLKAFWYLSGAYNQVSPRLSLGSPTIEGSKLNIPDGSGVSVSIGARWQMLMADIAFEQNGGFYNVRDASSIDALSDVINDYPFVEGKFSATEVRGKIGFDLVYAVQNIIAKRQILKLKQLDWPWTKFLRYNVGMSGGYSIPTKTRFITADGGALLDTFFAANPEIERNSLTDISKNKARWTVGLFMNWEMGPFAVEFDWHGYNDFGWRTSVGLRYMIPMNQLKSIIN